MGSKSFSLLSHTELLPKYSSVMGPISSNSGCFFFFFKWSKSAEGGEFQIFWTNPQSTLDSSSFWRTYWTLPATVLLHSQSAKLLYMPHCAPIRLGCYFHTEMKAVPGDKRVKPFELSAKWLYRSKGLWCYTYNTPGVGSLSQPEADLDHTSSTELWGRF